MTSSISLQHSSLNTLPEWHKFVKAVDSAVINPSQPRILKAADISFDFSTQRYSDNMLKSGVELLKLRHFDKKKQQLFDGAILNKTEGRPAWHTMLRQPRPTPEVAYEFNRVLEFIRRADSNRRWKNIVHIGIGGSDWGVRLAITAFGYKGTWRNIRYVANIDGHAIEAGLAGLDPHDTLIVIATKSFTTSETMTNAQRALEWLQAAKVPNPYNNIIAITAKPEVAKAWGVPEYNIFKFWEWVGGRFSIWSAIGAAVGLTVGTEVLAGLQNGAHAMDQHFLRAPVENNVPVQMALIEVANRSVLGLPSRNLAVYDSRLANLIPYLQQLEMESLGKSVNTQGEPIDTPTGGIVWGMPGTDAQHTFFQWLHQGTDEAPVDFIVCQQDDHNLAEHHQHLLSHCLAQREGLLKGKSLEEAYAENIASGMSNEQAQSLAKHRTLPGNRASSLIVLPKLTPFTLGALLAMYEHKVFVQSVIWDINPFDQWGVELGKVLAKDIFTELKTGMLHNDKHDASTNYWIQQFAKPNT